MILHKNLIRSYLRILLHVTAYAIFRKKVLIISSYGGSGSKFLTNKLSEFYSFSYHLHDKSPPKLLTVPTRIAHKSEFTFSKYKVFLPYIYEIIFIIREPSESRIIRGSSSHCINIGGNIKDYKINLDEYVEMKKDTMNYVKHINNYLKPKSKRNYKVLVINYHKLFDKSVNINIPLKIKLSQKIFNKKKNSIKKYLVKKKTLRDLKKMYHNIDGYVKKLSPYFYV